jgi:hypothetical protein
MTSPIDFYETRETPCNALFMGARHRSDSFPYLEIKTVSLLDNSPTPLSILEV